MIHCARMRTAYAMIGLGFLVIFGGLYLADTRFIVPSASSRTIISNSSTSMPSALTLSSAAFQAAGSIPARFTCDGEKINPPLSISGVPENAKSLVLIMDDPDVPKALKQDGVFDHWVLFNLPAGRQAFDIEEGKIPEGATEGINSSGKLGYASPCPPAQYEPSEHRYVFKLYALDAERSLSAGASKADVEKAMEGRIIAETQLVGKYKRQ